MELAHGIPRLRIELTTDSHMWYEVLLTVPLCLIFEAEMHVTFIRDFSSKATKALLFQDAHKTRLVLQYMISTCRRSACHIRRTDPGSGGYRVRI